MLRSVLVKMRPGMSLCCGLVAVFLVSDGSFGQQPAAKPGRDIVPVVAQEPAAGKANTTVPAPHWDVPDVSLRGDQLTVAALEKLAGADWGKVSLEGKFTPAMLQCLRHPRSMKELRLTGTGLRGQWSELESVPSLTSLEIRETLTLWNLEVLGKLTQLRELSLPAELQLSVTGARQIARLTRLTSLSLARCDLDDAAFVELKSLVNLQKLDLTHTRVTDAGLLEVLPHLQQLRTLELLRYPSWSSSYSTPPISDVCLSAVCKLPELESLSLSGAVSDAGLMQVGKIPRLKHLNLSFVNITPAGLRGLENSNVETLSVNPGCLNLAYGLLPESMRRESAAVESLRKMKSLRSLTIQGSADFGSMNPFFGALPELGVSWNDP